MVFDPVAHDAMQGTWEEAKVTGGIEPHDPGNGIEDRDVVCVRGQVGIVEEIDEINGEEFVWIELVTRGQKSRVFVDSTCLSKCACGAWFIDQCLCLHYGGDR